MVSPLVERLATGLSSQIVFCTKAKVESQVNVYGKGFGGADENYHSQGAVTVLCTMAGAKSALAHVILTPSLGNVFIAPSLQ